MAGGGLLLGNLFSLGLWAAAGILHLTESSSMRIASSVPSTAGGSSYSEEWNGGHGRSWFCQVLLLAIHIIVLVSCFPKYEYVAYR
jgi:hypothetical protein